MSLYHFSLQSLPPKRGEPWCPDFFRFLCFSCPFHPRILSLIKGFTISIGQVSGSSHCDDCIALTFSKTFSRQRLHIFPERFLSMCLNYIVNYFSGTVLPMEFFLFCTNFIILSDVQAKRFRIYLACKIFETLWQLFTSFCSLIKLINFTLALLMM